MNENKYMETAVGESSTTCYICLEPIKTLLEDPVKPFECDHAVCRSCSSSLFTTTATKKCGICRESNVRGLDMILRIAAAHNPTTQQGNWEHRARVLLEQNTSLRARILTLTHQVSSLAIGSRDHLPQNLPPSLDPAITFPVLSADPTTRLAGMTNTEVIPITLGYNGGRRIQGVVSISIENDSALLNLFQDPVIHTTQAFGLVFYCKRVQAQFIEIRCNRTITAHRRYNNDAIGEIRGHNRKQLFSADEYKRFRILRRDNGAEYIQLNNTWRFLEINASVFENRCLLRDLDGDNNLN